MRKIVLFIVFLLLAAIVFVHNQPLPSRQAQVKVYMDEFVSQAFEQNYHNIYIAIQRALNGIPEYAFKKVTNRAFPVLFVEMPHFGGGRWANSNGIYVMPDDPPTFTHGLWIVKLSTKMNETKDIDAIEGVVLHELAHRVLDHKPGPTEVQDEKDANHLIEHWGFKHQFLEAKARFGTHGDMQ